MIFLSLIQLFFTIYGVVLISVFLFKMAVFFLFLRNVLLPIEILKIKILEHSDPSSQHFFVHKAFSHSFLCRRKVVLCHLAEWHNEKWLKVSPPFHNAISRQSISTVSCEGSANIRGTNNFYNKKIENMLAISQSFFCS